MAPPVDARPPPSPADLAYAPKHANASEVQMIVSPIHLTAVVIHPWIYFNVTLNLVSCVIVYIAVLKSCCTEHFAS